MSKRDFHRMHSFFLPHPSLQRLIHPFRRPVDVFSEPTKGGRSRRYTPLWDRMTHFIENVNTKEATEWNEERETETPHIVTK